MFRSARTVSAVAAVLMAGLLAPAAGWAATPSVTEIMDRNFVVSRVLDSTADATFRLINAGGEERLRRTQTLSKLEDNGLDAMRLTRFQSPPDVKGTATLTVEHNPGDDDIWVYLPAMKKVRRLTASNKKDAYVGTDFSYGDVIGYRPSEWENTITGTESDGGVTVYIVTSVPKTPEVRDNSGYSKRVQWIRADNFIAVRGQLFDTAGQLLKEFKAGDIQRVDAARGRWQPMVIEMRNVQTGHLTEIRMENYKANQGLAGDLFTTRNLDRN